MDGEESGSEEADSLVKNEDINTGGVKLEDNSEVEDEVGHVEHRGGEADQSHGEPGVDHLYD